MKAALFYYDGFAEFEVSLALLSLLELKWSHFALENRPYKSLEGQTFLVSHTLEQLDPEDLDLILIPGGDSLPLFKADHLKSFIVKCLEKGGIVAGICGGSELLAGFGLLDGLHCTGGATGISKMDPISKYYERTQLEGNKVVTDRYASGLIITAQGQSYEIFADTLRKVIEMRKQ